MIGEDYDDEEEGFELAREEDDEGDFYFENPHCGEKPKV